MIYIDIQIDDAKLRKNVEDLTNTQGPRGGRVKRVYTAWAVRYSAAVRKAFRNNASGAGIWAPLKPSTIASRRFGQGKTIGQARKKIKAAARRASKTAKILMDTGMLFAALALTNRNNKTVLTENSVRFGIAGGKLHKKNEKMTLSSIALAHHRGAGNLPKRPIFLIESNMPPQLKAGFANDVKRLLKD